MAREFLLFVLESAYGTPMTPTLAEMWTTSGSGTAGVGVGGFVGFYGRLDDGNAFTMRPRPVMVEVPYGGGLAIPAFTVADKYVIEGSYKTKLYAGPFSQFLLQWAAQQINSHNIVAGAGVSTGWAHSDAPGNLPSVYCLHAIQRSDGSYKCRGYPGVKVKSFALDISEGSTVGTITMQLVGSAVVGNPWTIGNSVDPTLQTFASPATPPAWNTTTTPSTFCPPATANLPINPYVFVNASGGLTIGTPTRSTFQSINLAVNNTIATRFWANRYVQFAQFTGRKVTLSAQQFYVNMSPEDRLEYETLVTQTVTVVLTGASHSLTVTLNTANVINSLEDALPLADIYTQNINLTNQWDTTVTQTDPALACDLSLSFT